MVAISREPSAACPAASSAALYYEGFHDTASGAGAANAVDKSPAASKSKSSDGSSSLFGRLQKSFDKTMQKTAKTLLGKDSSEEHTTAGLPSFSNEEEQLQWALNASLRDNGAKSVHTTVPLGSKVASSEAVVEQRPVSSSVSNETVAQKARDAAAESEKAELRRQLAESEGIIKGLTEQLDGVNMKLEKKTAQCKALEKALLAAQEALAVAERNTAQGEQQAEAEDFERQGTIAQLLARIAELEATLLQATHFATDFRETEQTSAPVAEDANEAPSSALPVSDVVEAALPESPLEESTSTGPVAFSPPPRGADTCTKEPAVTEPVVDLVQKLVSEGGEGSHAELSGEVVSKNVEESGPVLVDSAAAPPDQSVDTCGSGSASGQGSDELQAAADVKTVDKSDEAVLVPSVDS
eukprot:TRINITY_DN18940_c0_g1_i1.p1 TRINITY_DN18940_c0_g1~~TRINITY_DN18940_c0_g1_i1.p1  ORF type:complete len:460 (+),score=86.29 TRINITY_DN18940_c0_g1_i1:145-1380(+)